MNVARVGKYRSLGEKFFESAVIAGAEAGQVVVAKLVDDDRENQLGFRVWPAAESNENVIKSGEMSRNLRMWTA